MRTRLVAGKPRAVASLFLSIVLLTGPVVGQPEPAETYEVKLMGKPLGEVVDTYGRVTGKTPLIAPRVNVNALITVKGKNKLTKEEYIAALESILALNDVAIIPHGDKFVKVVSAVEGTKHAMVTEVDPAAEMPADSDQVLRRVVRLSHMDPTEAEAVIGTFKSTHGTIQKLERINGLLITDSALNIKRILEILEQVDQPVDRQEEVFIRPIRHTKPSEVKAKLEEIIADLKEKKKSTPTVATPRTTGPPGVMRARKPLATAASAPDVDVEKGLIRGQVKIVADDRTGVLIFVTVESNMAFFQQIVDALDIETDPDVLVEVYRLEFATAAKVAGMLNSLIGAKGDKGAPATAKDAPKGGALEEYISSKRKTVSEAAISKVGELSAKNVKILDDERTNALIVMASRADQAALAEIIKDMDMMLSQVLIEAVIIEVTLTDNLQTGVDWIQRSMMAYKTGPNNKKSPVMAFAGGGGGGKSAPVNAVDTPPISGSGLSYYFTHFGVNMNAVIKAVSSDTRSRVMSSPVILTTDNTDAVITSTEQIYVYKGTRQATAYAAEYNEYAPQRVGLELTVKPQINENKVVMMKINQKMSEPGDEGEPQSGKKISSERTLDASIAVRSGETIILGGQVRRSSTKVRDKIPLLGDIPLLGRLFNWTTDTTDRKEMIVFITPYVLDTPSEIEAEAMRRKRAIDLKGVWKKGWSNSKLAEPNEEEIEAMKKSAKERRRQIKEEAEERRAAEKAEAKRRKEAEEEQAKEQKAAAEKAERERAAEEARAKLEQEETRRRRAEEEKAKLEREIEELKAAKLANAEHTGTEESVLKEGADNPQVQALIDREAARWRNAERTVDTVTSQEQ